MNNQTYESPEIIVLEMRIEKNMMATGESGSGDPFGGQDG